MFSSIKEYFARRKREKALVNLCKEILSYSDQPDFWINKNLINVDGCLVAIVRVNYWMWDCITLEFTSYSKWKAPGMPHKENILVLSKFYGPARTSKTVQNSMIKLMQTYRDKLKSGTYPSKPLEVEVFDNENNDIPFTTIQNYSLEEAIEEVVPPTAVEIRRFGTNNFNIDR